MQHMTFSKHTAIATGLTLLLGGSGSIHFARPQTFDPIVPRSLPGSPAPGPISPARPKW
ncbi:hypothetical protein GCM10025867_26140 [Frondihabitans sucicola]|uniref:Uncharacterized protein n=2 Tax=Frondihabitans sucicola TaxID=1268041 RepID=A0ABN6Y2Z7_9MICO|nr:hypothetical protein GCM10025867_26140 [Frondihabitans sucicola]